jgi:hypothetical protein
MVRVGIDSIFIVMPMPFHQVHPQRFQPLCHVFAARDWTKPLQMS